MVWEERILQIKFWILSLTYTRDVILNGWLTIWKTLIPKDKETEYIHWYRNITLVEGDLQYLMKILYSNAMMQPISPLLQTNQNALRDHATQSSILSYIIEINTIFIEREKSIITENDAKNFFERILMHIAAFAFNRVGMTKKIMSLYLNLLESAECHVLLGGGIHPKGSLSIHILHQQWGEARGQDRQDPRGLRYNRGLPHCGNGRCFKAGIKWMGNGGLWQNTWNSAYHNISVK